MQDLQRPGLLQRQADAALAPIGVFHQGGEGTTADRHAHHGAQAALGVAGFGVFDLDDVGAPVGQDRTRGRDEGELRHLQYPEAVHRSDHSCLLMQLQFPGR